MIPKLNDHITIKVVCLDLEGNYLAEYPSARIASTILGLKSIGNVLNNIYGYTLTTHNKYFFVDKKYYNPSKDYSLKYRKLLRKLNKSK